VHPTPPAHGLNGFEPMGSFLPSISLYLTRHGDGLKLATTGKVDDMLRRMGRSSRKADGAIVALVVLNSRDNARKVRRVFERHWRGKYRGGGEFSITETEVGPVLRYLEEQHGVACYGRHRKISVAAKTLALEHFAGGRRAVWRGKPEDYDARSAQLQELLAEGAITKHRRRKSGEISYRGTAKTSALALALAKSQVPKRGEIPHVEQRQQVLAEIVIPEPHMARELLLHRMDEAAEVGHDPQDVLNAQGYRGAMANLTGLIGGLAQLKGLTEAQKRGAAQYKQVAEHAELGGAKAIDYSAVKVDVSIGENIVADLGAGARAEWHGAREALGHGTLRLAVIDRMVLAGQSVREVAQGLGYGQSGAARKIVADAARNGATVLAGAFGCLPRSRRGRVNVARADRPTVFAEDPEGISRFISSPKMGKARI